MNDLSDYQKQILRDMGIPLYKMNLTEETDINQTQTQLLEQHQRKQDNQYIKTQTQGSEKPASMTDKLDKLEGIAACIKQCTACQLHNGRTNTVPGIGSPQADWMFVGEAPGQNEDEQGEPFVGRAGKLLDAIIFSLGMKRHQIFIANVIKCRPPANRDPQPNEVAQCETYLHQQLDLIRPKVIVALGRVSAQALLKTQSTLGSLRGKFHQYGNQNTPLVATYHPAYLLRSPQQKAKVWADLLMARTLFD